MVSGERMEMGMKRIGILTGGGDCPGLNAVIRVVAKAAHQGGMEVVGIEDGYLGLVEGRMRTLQPVDVTGILTHGGTILGSCNKTNPAAVRVKQGDTVVLTDMQDVCLQHCRDRDLYAVVVIGGDGTMTAAASLSRLGLRVIGVPKTIDNDLWATHVTFGHDTAVTTAAEALDKVHTTASSHHRVMVVELMGRYAGWLTLGAGVASGADVILLPEIPFDLEKVAAKCRERSKVGKRFTVIAVGEGAAPVGGQQFVDHVDESSPDPVRLGGVGKFVADQVERLTGIESRSMVLGHVQRGGTPTPRDRVLATVFGSHAYDLLRAEKFGCMVVRCGGELGYVPLADVAGKVRTVPADHELIRAAKAIGTSFGQ